MNDIVKDRILYGLLILIIVIGAYHYEDAKHWARERSVLTDIHRKSLLLNDYQKSKKRHVKDVGYDDIHKNYPIFPADSVLNNNIRYWRRPTNGSCIPPELCSGFYEDTPVNFTKNIPAPSDTTPRVNYYNAIL